jgi:hypothetical protein
MKKEIFEPEFIETMKVLRYVLKGKSDSSQTENSDSTNESSSPPPPDRDSTKNMQHNNDKFDSPSSGIHNTDNPLI